MKFLLFTGVTKVVIYWCYGPHDKSLTTVWEVQESKWT